MHASAFSATGSGGVGGAIMVAAMDDGTANVAGLPTAALAATTQTAPARQKEGEVLLRWLRDVDLVRSGDDEVLRGETKGSKIKGKMEIKEPGLGD
jgi:hypothetical protein